MICTTCDKDKVLNWLKEYCYGFRHARTKKNIIPFIGLTERYFREIVSQLKHDGLLASTSSDGYWYVDPLCEDIQEIDAHIRSVNESRSRAMDQLRDTSQLLTRLETKRIKVTQKQKELF